jgi:hypothetical protein
MWLPVVGFILKTNLENSLHFLRPIIAQDFTTLHLGVTNITFILEMCIVTLSVLLAAVSSRKHRCVKMQGWHNIHTKFY